MTFQVNLAPGTRPGVYPNTAALSYNDGTATKTSSSNTVDITVAQASNVTFTGQTLATVNQGATAVFGVQRPTPAPALTTENLLTNNGNGVDTFDITFAGSTYPAGTVFQLFQSDNAATLLDSNGNGIPDTGPIPPGGTYRVVLRAILPAGSTAIGPFSVDLVATSSSPTKSTATATDTVTAVSPATVELTNVNLIGTGQGAGALTATPVTTLPRAPGSTQTFTLTVNNKSGAPDNYALSYSTTNAFAPATALPAGFTVVFRNAAGTVITNTGNIAALGSINVTADVFVPAGATPQNVDLFFRVLSGSTNASDVKFDRVTVSTIRSLVITPNNNGQVFPGSSVNYGHTITNTGNQAETIALVATDNKTGFSSVIYADTDGDGQLSAAELAAGPITSTGPLAAAGSRDANGKPTDTLKIIVKVFGPSSEFQSGQANQTLVTATAAGTGAPASSATDVTTIVAGDVLLEKFQSVNGATATKGNATALPGGTIQYTIVVTNTGGAPVNNIVVSDNTPAFTTYSTGDTTTTPAGVAVLTTNGITFTAATSTPANGAAGTLTWTILALAPNAKATITFNVKINN